MNQASSAPDGAKSVGSWLGAALDWLSALLLSLLIFCIAHAKGLLSPFVVNDDVRQQLFWMASYIDPELFPLDLLGEYSRVYVPEALKLLYRAAAMRIDPLYFSKLLTGALYTTFCLGVFGLGRALSGRRAGYACLAAAWLMPYFLYNMSGGLARAFTAPLMVLFLLSWVRGLAWGMALTLLLQALYIPYIFVLCAGAALMAFVYELVFRRKLSPYPSRSKLSLGFFALSLGLALWFNFRFNLSGFGPLIWASQAAGRPEFGNLGRLELLPLENPFFDLVYYPFERVGLFLELGLIPGIISLVIILGLALWGAFYLGWRELKSKAAPFLFLALASLTLYAAARILAFKLFVPERYVSYSFNIFYCLILGLCLGALFNRLNLSRIKTAGALVCLAGLAALRLYGSGLYDYSKDAPLYAALAETPKKALIAGHPELMDNVLTFGKRNALLSFELAHVWSQGLWEKLKPRYDDFFAAYYASDPEVVRAFCRKYKIDYLVVDEKHFRPEFLASKTCFEPYASQARELAKSAGSFALLSGETFAYRESGSGQRIIDTRGLLQ